MRKPWAAPLPLALLAGGLIATPQLAAPTPAAAAPVTTLSPAAPIKMEHFYFYSSQPTQFIRPVVLQKKTGSSWKTIFSGKTGANGKFRFTVHTGSVDTLRAYSAATTYKGKTYGRIGTTPVTVRPLTQTTSLSTPTTATPGTTIAITATSTPARSGRGVTLQQQKSGTWTTIATGKLNTQGRGTFKTKAPATNTKASYRAIASTWNGAPATTSNTTNVTGAAGTTYVSIPDKALLDCIDSQLDLKSGTQITVSQASTITWLNCSGGAVSNGPISNIQGLQQFTNVTFLDLTDNQISDLAPLAQLSRLNELHLGHNRISGFTALSRLDALTEIDLTDNLISNADLSSLAYLINLKYLFLGDNEKISDISSLQNLTNLISLGLYHNSVVNIDPLKGMASMADLDLSGNKISDISALSHLANLASLSLGNDIEGGENSINDIEPLSNLRKLASLNLTSASLVDISPLRNITSLQQLVLDHNKISNVNSLKGLARLTQLNLNNNSIEDISALASVTNLETLDLSSNHISNVSSLGNLTRLTELYLKDNQISDSSPLDTLTKLTHNGLTFLNLAGNPVCSAAPSTRGC